MSNGNATLLDAGAANECLFLAIGDMVCVKPGTLDPDFSGWPLDGWVGEIVELDATSTPRHYLVRWNEDTVARMPPDCRDWCEREDVALDQMWLFDVDLDPLAV